MAESLYQRLIGQAWEELPAVIQRFHGAVIPVHYRGLFCIRRGNSMFASLMASALGMPRAGDAVPVRLLITPQGTGEHWWRAFGADVFETDQAVAQDNLLVERIGRLELYFHLRIVNQRLAFEQVKAAIALGNKRIFLPRCLSPYVSAHVSCEGGDAHVTVKVTVPFVGPILSYEGYFREDVHA